MSSTLNPLTRRQVEACVVPVHVGAGASQPVFLMPLGNLGRPIEQVELDEIGVFINRHIPAAESSAECAGELGRSALGHDGPRDVVVANLLNQFANWVRDAALTVDELQAVFDVSVGFTAVMRHADSKWKAA